VKVAGGTYDEIVVVPESKDLMGSGMRAAAALSRAPSRPILHTVLDDGTGEEAGYVAEALGVALGEHAVRDERVGFRYITPVSPPSVNGPSARVNGQTKIADSSVLLFGLVEAPQGAFKVDADLIVFDPQKPRDTDPLQRGTMSSGRIILVANETEVTKLGGQGPGRNGRIMSAAEAILADRADIDGVVTKRGAIGSLVSRRVGSEVRHEAIGAHPTRRVWPIGSGDTFSAGLAFALDQGADLVEAAQVGSAAAAHWCSTRNPAVPLEILLGDFSAIPEVGPTGSGRVYLASPFFSVAERWLVETVRDALLSLGVDVWSPVHEVGPGGDEVAQQDLDGLRQCDAVLALLDHSDPGTIFEVGWAVSRRMPVIGFGSSVDPEGLKMMTGTTVEMHRDLATACYRAAWAAMGVAPIRGWLR
jgi:nucleoside 2-deoxyribosyltransferase